MRRKFRQGLLFESNWGGRRRGAGRKGSGKRRRVRHTARSAVEGKWPVHVIWRLIEGLQSLRKKEILDLVVKALEAIKENGNEFRVIHFSIQSNHIHMIVEAENKKTLAKGMQRLGVRLARGINKFFGRAGRVFEGRYFSRILKTPREVRRALVYVLQNFKKHGRIVSKTIDALSSGVWFKGWKEAVKGLLKKDFFKLDPPVSQCKSWLLTEGWRRHGLIGALERPR